MTGPGGPGGVPPADAPRRRVWWVVALVTGLVVAATSGTVLVGRLARQSAHGSYTSRHAVSEVQIQSEGASVSITAGPAGDVVVRRQLGWLVNRPTFVRQWVGDVLKITVSCPGVGPVPLPDCRAVVRIQVPENTAVQSLATSGDTTVTGISGALDLSSGSGPLTVDGASGPVVADTASGPIQAVDLRSSQVQARSTSGPQSLVFTRAPELVTARSSSGPIEVDVPGGTHYRASAVSRSGPASVDDGLAEPGARGSVTATSGSGPVDIAYAP